MLAVNVRRQLTQLRRLDRQLYRAALVAIPQVPQKSAGVITAEALKLVLAEKCHVPSVTCQVSDMTRDALTRDTFPCSGWVRNPNPVEGRSPFQCCPDPAVWRLTIQTRTGVYTTCRCQRCRDRVAAEVTGGATVEILNEEVI